jgi:hypothetical protein
MRAGEAGILDLVEQGSISESLFSRITLEGTLLGRWFKSSPRTHLQANSLRISQEA